LKDAFPEVDSGMGSVFGSRILVQIRVPSKYTKGGIAIPEESRETERWNTQVSKVIQLGPVAYRNRDTLELWPEGEWVAPGMYVRTPKYAGDRWEVPQVGSLDKVLFGLFDDLDFGGEIPAEMVLTVVAYIP